MKTFGKILLTLLTIVLAAALCLTTLFAAASGCVRRTFTPEKVYGIMSGMDYASLELPDGYGGFENLCTIINQTVGGLGLSFTEPELNSAVRTFSVDAILTSFLQDFRTWLLDDGPLPVLDSHEMAQTIVNGLDSGITGLMSLFGDPAAMLSNLLEGVTESAKLGDRLKTLEPARDLLSKETLIFALSTCAVVFLLILLCCKLKFFRAVVWAGCSSMAAGAVLMFAEPLAQPMKNHLLAEMAMPESTIDIVYRPLMEGLHAFGSTLALAGLAAALIAGMIGLFGGMIRREKEKTDAARNAQFMMQ